jgi:UDP-N-acetylglucosamine 4,6-dehydratase
MMLSLNLERMIQGKNILITGGTGTIGSALVRKILGYQPAVVRIYSRDETKQLELLLSLKNPANVRYLIGDIRDSERLGKAFEDIDYVFHTAALKHLPACEFNPFEAIKTNVIGTQNLIDQSIAKGVKLVIGISTDKVVNPSSILGTTKLLAEKLLIAANFSKGRHRTIFSCVRFGNVAGARGSVIPVFLDQLSRHETLTVTDPQMTRFIMSTDEAVDLVLKAASLAGGGEIFIFTMPSVKVNDIAEAIAGRFMKVTGETVKIEISGLRPGEKLHEELIVTDELHKTFRYENLLILASDYGHLPPGIPLDLSNPPVLSSDAQEPLSQTEILELVKPVDRCNILKWEAQYEPHALSDCPGQTKVQPPAG